MQIIDATLSMLDETPPTKEQAGELIQLFMECGIYDFVISEKLYPVIEPALISGAVYYMELDSVSDRKRFPLIKHFLQSKTVGEDTITIVQMNDTREILHLRNYISAKSIVLKGMDDFMCFDFDIALKEIFSIIDKKRILFMPENSNECATAEAVMFMREGGKKVITAFAGIGNKAATEQVILALRLNQHYKVNQDLSKLPKLKSLYEEITSDKIPAKMPVIGESIFWVESGIHVDGILKKSSNYETFPPELVGQERKIVIGKHSGLSSIKIKLIEFGYNDFDKEICLVILKNVKLESSRLCRNINDEELKAIIEGCL
ncbi:homocitrate synthase/isopropylmalate synthase family protein [Anaerosporobacter sp.]|uniref:homocitrate synthase/isopropylmalate synthase family protein n=1 Tax=Anaerosporobacter sp. TaxID=1872529 RepID=UPI00286F1955|nr:hypothetical protein [Anaerosporobacter sp.]